MSARDPDLRISPEDADALVKSGEAVILDVVSSSSYATMHEAVAGAIRIPPEELADRLDELPKSRTITTYCTWLNEETSARAALMLRDRGFRAFAIKGGFLAWKQAGLPLEPKEFEQAAGDQVCPECGRLLSEHEGHAHTL